MVKSLDDIAWSLDHARRDLLDAEWLIDQGKAEGALRAISFALRYLERARRLLDESEESDG